MTSFQFIFGDHLPPHKPCGLLAVEHAHPSLPDQCDGLCLSLLVVCKDQLEETVNPKPGFTWLPLDSSLQELLLSKVASKRHTLVHAAL